MVCRLSEESRPYFETSIINESIIIIMRRIILSFVLSLLCAGVMFAQRTLVATLTHGTETSQFYGSYALQAAYEAAVSGDIINLSGGAFQAVGIKKSVILRGAGIDVEKPTYIKNSFSINIPEEDTNRFSMEGIRCTSDVDIYDTFCNPYFLKCQFEKSFTFKSFKGALTRKSIVANCKLVGGASIQGRDDVQFVNCYLNSFYNSLGDATPVLVNCIIYGGNGISNAKSSQLLNSIICGKNNSSSLPSTAVATNCVAVNFKDSYDIFKDLEDKEGCTTSTLAEVFKNFDGTYTDDQTFELTDAAQKTLLGTDGTQVGLYGGMLPYDSTPSYPQITKMNAGSKATADGKLSVDIEVNAAK
jgi:hypothetical protein